MALVLYQHCCHPIQDPCQVLYDAKDVPLGSEWRMEVPGDAGAISSHCVMSLVFRIPFHFGLVFTLSLPHRDVHAHGVRARQGILVLMGLWNSSRRFSSEVWICAHKGRIQLFFIMCLSWSYVRTNLSAVTLAFCHKIAEIGSKLGTLGAIKWRSIVCLDSPRHPKHREDIAHAGCDHIGRVGTEEVHHWLTWVGIHSHRGLDGRRPQKPDFWVPWNLREPSHLEWFCSGECTVALFQILGNQTFSLRRIRSWEGAWWASSSTADSRITFSEPLSLRSS